MEEFKVEDGDKLILLIIDPQNDFHPAKDTVRPEGPLAVPGANEDTARIVELINNSVKLFGRQFDQIIVTLDTHNVNHIAHASFWDGEIQKFTVISKDDMDKYTPKDKSLVEWCNYYIPKLQENANKPLVIWPEHCIQGSYGHGVVKELADALNAWSKTTGKTVDYRQKGQNNLTEMYSALKAEVPITSDPKTQLNIDLLNALLNPKYDYNTKSDKVFHSDSVRAGGPGGQVDTNNQVDTNKPVTPEPVCPGSMFNTDPSKYSSVKVFICGQALSHCVSGTTDDIVNNASTYGVDTKKSLILLRDCTSPVGGYEEAAETWVTNNKDSKITVIQSTDLVPKSGGRTSRRRHPKKKAGKRRSSRR